MELKDILAKCDHTLLGQTATWAEIKAICDDGIKYGCASVCIPASFVQQAKQYVGDRLAICTVIGFPNGYSTAAVKAYEAAAAVADGADEVDMVINVGLLKDKKYGDLLNEINEIKNADVITMGLGNAEFGAYIMHKLMACQLDSTFNLLRRKSRFRNQKPLYKLER